MKFGDEEFSPDQTGMTEKMKEYKDTTVEGESLAKPKFSYKNLKKDKRSRSKGKKDDRSKSPEDYVDPR